MTSYKPNTDMSDELWYLWKEAGVSPAQDDLLKCPSSTTLWLQVKKSSLVEDQHLPKFCSQ